MNAETRTPEMDTADWLSRHWDADYCRISACGDGYVQIECGEGGTIVDVSIGPTSVTIDHDGNPLTLPRDGWVAEFAAWLEEDAIGPEWDDYERTGRSGDTYTVALRPPGDGHNWLVAVEGPQGDRQSIDHSTRAAAVETAKYWAETCDSFADALEEEED